MGDHPEYLTALVGGNNRRAAVIANAMDDAPGEVRGSGVEGELAALTELGFDAAELDLRGYIDDGNRLGRDLAGLAVTWLRGGNVFMLRYALRRSGGDAVFRDLLAEDALVYAGYSAGACVLSPSLRGLEAVDDADAVARIYGAGPVWDGLALLGEAFVPALPVTGPPRDGRHRACGRAISSRGDPVPCPARWASARHQRRGPHNRVAASTKARIA
jgi:dipeptidase E